MSESFVSLLCFVLFVAGLALGVVAGAAAYVARLRRAADAANHEHARYERCWDRKVQLEQAVRFIAFELSYPGDDDRSVTDATRLVNVRSIIELVKEEGRS